MTTATDRTAALAERLFADTLGALELHSIFLGVELGLYESLETHGPSTPPQLAERAGIAPRYAREWLEQQAVAGLLDVEHPAAAADARRYALAPDHARVLAHPDDAAHVAPFAHMLAGIGGVLPRVVDAYRTGGGVPYADYGRAFRHGQGHINRPAFTHELPTDWLAAMPDVARAPGEHPPSAGGRRRLRTGLLHPRRSPAPSSTRTSTGSTSTRARSPTPARTPPTPASTAACASCTPTRAAWPRTAHTTWSCCSRRCTTWPTRPRRCPPRAPP